MPALDLDLDELPVNRALGVEWNIALDEFGFKIADLNKPNTMRGVLSTISSVFDPLNFAVPVMLPAKQIMQSLWRRKAPWDQPIIEETLEKWLDWKSSLPLLREITVPRCYFSRLEHKGVTFQLHHFCDASESGYGTVSYLRFEYLDGFTECAFVTGKSRNAPIKSVSIPRFELQGAQKRSSDWVQTLRRVAWLLKYLDWLRWSAEKNAGRNAEVKYVERKIENEDLERAKRRIAAVVQARSFPKEARELKDGKPVKTSSKIFKLKPFMNDGVMCVGGKVSMAPISADAKNPMILPKDHHVATILIRYLHEVNGHCGVEQVLSLLREQFWVVKARGAIKRVLRSCVHCRKQMAARMNQLMGDLPRVRLTLYESPFTYCGVDYFGPFYVKRGRGRVIEKRWGAISLFV